MANRVYRLFMLVLVVLSLSAALFGQEVKKYRGAKVDNAATEEATRMAGAESGLEVTVYITSDPFDKVCAFYKENAHEYAMPGKRVRKLPSGQELRDAFFLFDDTTDLLTSKAWVKVQRPYIGSGVSRDAAASEIRDVTAIVISVRK